eukprot:IDg23032t1
MGLDILYREQLVTDTVFNRLAKRIPAGQRQGSSKYIDEWFIPISRSTSGHRYIPIASGYRIFFAKSYYSRYPSNSKGDINAMRTMPTNAPVPPAFRFIRRRERSYALLRCEIPQARSVEAIWDAILKCWATIYTGLPNRMLVDQGSALGKSDTFVSIAARSNVHVESTVIEAHSSLGIGERYHRATRNALRKMRAEYPTAPQELLLQ